MKNLKILALIPARMGSSRFPGKPLKRIKGISMIERVYKNSSVSELVTTTYVATCDKEIYRHVKEFGGNVVMTSKKHKRASDRCAEALLKIENIKTHIIDLEYKSRPESQAYKLCIDLGIKVEKFNRGKIRINFSIDIVNNSNQIKVLNTEINKYLKLIKSEKINLNITYGDIINFIEIDKNKLLKKPYIRSKFFMLLQSCILDLIKKQKAEGKLTLKSINSKLLKIVAI